MYCTISHKLVSVLTISSAKKPLPIATLPMINGKLYIITQPALIQSAYRNKNLSFDPFMIDFAQRMLDLSEVCDFSKRYPLLSAVYGTVFGKNSWPERLSLSTVSQVWQLRLTYMQEVMVAVRGPNFIPDIVKGIHSSMLGEHLYKMNADALNNVAVTINSLSDTFKPDSLYLWIRETLTMATCNTLLGSHNPLKDDLSLVDDLWEFEAGILPLVLGIMPSIVAPKAYKARASVQTALKKYYGKGYDLDSDVAKLTKVS